MIYNYSTAHSLNTIFKIFLSIFLFSSLLTSCNTLRSHSRADNLEAIKTEGSFQIRVRSGNSTIDDEIHRSAVYMFSRHLSVSPANKTNKAHIDIIFNSRIKSGQSPYPKNLSYGKTWYTGSNMPEISEISANINSTGPLDRLSSTMTLRIYDQDGSELWTARHELEIASPLIRRADQAALHNLKTIFSEFEKEFIIKPETVPAAQQISNNSLQKLPDENQSSADTIESLSLHNGNVMPAMLIIQSNEPDKPNAVNEEPQTESPDSAEQ